MSKEIIRLLRDDGQLTLEQARRIAYLNFQIHRREKMYMWILYGLILLLGTCTAFAFESVIHRTNLDVYTRCRTAQINVASGNRFYRHMAELEASNSFIDARLRAARVAAYTSVVLVAPHCGSKP